MLIRVLTTLLVMLLLAQPPVSLNAAEGTADRARKLINALGCKGCHKVEGKGASLAPDLDRIGSRMTHSQITQHLATHITPDKDAFMPSYNTTSPAELKLLSNFLYNLQ